MTGARGRSGIRRLGAVAALRRAAVDVLGAFWFVLVLNGPKTAGQQELVDSGLLPPLTGTLIPFAVFATFSVLFRAYFRLPAGLGRRRHAG